jgi:hypothetical protein
MLQMITGDFGVGTNVLLLTQLKVDFPNHLSSIRSGGAKNPSGGLLDKAEEIAGFRAYLLLIGKQGPPCLWMTI